MAEWWSVCSLRPSRTWRTGTFCWGRGGWRGGHPGELLFSSSVATRKGMGCCCTFIVVVLRRSQCKLGWPQTQYIGKDDLKLWILPSLGSLVSAIMPGSAMWWQDKEGFLLYVQAGIELLLLSLQSSEILSSRPVWAIEFHSIPQCFLFSQCMHAFFSSGH